MSYDDDSSYGQRKTSAYGEDSEGGYGGQRTSGYGDDSEYGQKKTSYGEEGGYAGETGRGYGGRKDSDGDGVPDEFEKSEFNREDVSARFFGEFVYSVSSFSGYVALIVDVHGWVQRVILAAIFHCWSYEDPLLILWMVGDRHLTLLVVVAWTLTCGLCNVQVENLKDRTDIDDEEKDRRKKKLMEEVAAGVVGAGVLGVAGYAAYNHFNKDDDDKKEGGEGGYGRREGGYGDDEEKPEKKSWF